MPICDIWMSERFQLPSMLNIVLGLQFFSFLKLSYDMQYPNRIDNQNVNLPAFECCLCIAVFLNAINFVLFDSHTNSQ